MSDVKLNSGFEMALFIIVATVAALLPAYYMSNLWHHAVVPLGVAEVGVLRMLVINSILTMATFKKTTIQETPWAYLFDCHLAYLTTFGIARGVVAIGL